MGKADRELAARWLEYAEEDLAAAESVLARSTPLLRTALFHCQQAAEKALKAVLAGAGTVPPRTHDLAALLDLAVATSAELESRREDAERLTDYATEPRYPEPEQSYSVPEAEAALESARRLVNAVKERS